MNWLYYGDNLQVLREHIPEASVDLIYLDPPFNSNRSYNVLFKESSGKGADAQITAFDDTWHWGPAAEETLRDIVATAPRHVVEMMQAIVGNEGAEDQPPRIGFLGRNNDMCAYLVMMTVRLLELHRVLKPTGSLYLHCDPTASHYLKVVLDTIFGPERFGNEISWRRSNPKSHTTTNYANCRDVILRYTKGDAAVFNKGFGEHDPSYVEKAYRYKDEQGRPYRLLPLLNPNQDRPNLSYEFLGVTRVWRWTRQRMEKAYADGVVVQLKPGAVPQYKKYLADSLGRTITDDWSDINQVGGNERMGYPTQKPLALLERIINASSNPGDVVLDPFCGCGTTICAAQKLGRQWIGIDITHLSIALMRQRLDTMFGDAALYEVHGQPKDLESAVALSRADRYEFQKWALSLIKARPWQEKKGSDQGVDGVLYFQDELRKRDKQAVVQVKSGGVSARDIRDLGHVVTREGAALGLLITLEAPSRPMEIEALGSGVYHSPGWNRDYQRLQVRTIAQLLAGEGFAHPPANVTLPSAEREKEGGEQGARLLSHQKRLGM